MPHVSSEEDPLAIREEVLNIVELWPLQSFQNEACWCLFLAKKGMKKVKINRAVMLEVHEPCWRLKSVKDDIFPGSCSFKTQRLPDCGVEFGQKVAETKGRRAEWRPGGSWVYSGDTHEVPCITCQALLGN